MYNPRDQQSRHAGLGQPQLSKIFFEKDIGLILSTSRASSTAKAGKPDQHAISIGIFNRQIYICTMEPGRM